MHDKRVRVLTFLLSASTVLGIGIGFSIACAAASPEGSGPRYVFCLVGLMFAFVSGWMILTMRRILGETK